MEQTLFLEVEAYSIVNDEEISRRDSTPLVVRLI